MLSAEALRLAAIEVLCPTAALLAGNGYPTLAGKRVFDSRAAQIDDVDDVAPYTPVLSLYTRSSEAVLAGAVTDASDTQAEAILEIVGELAVIVKDEGEAYADALAGSDPEARLVLAAMMAQARSQLEFSSSGGLFRRMRLATRRVDIETMALPEYGLRWHRMFMRMHCQVPDDEFDMVAGGLPQPLAALAAALPAQSYAKGKLTELAARFAGEARTPLDMVTLTEPGSDEPRSSVAIPQG